MAKLGVAVVGIVAMSGVYAAGVAMDKAMVAPKAVSRILPRGDWCIGSTIYDVGGDTVFDFSGFRGLTANAEVGVQSAPTADGPWSSAVSVGAGASIPVDIGRPYLRFRSDRCGVNVRPICRRIAGCPCPEFGGGK